MSTTNQNEINKAAQDVILAIEAAGNGGIEILSPRAAIEAVRAEVATREGVTTHEYRFCGTEFRLARRELGHLHGSIADLPFPRRIRDELVAAGRSGQGAIGSGPSADLPRNDFKRMQSIPLLSEPRPAAIE